MRPRKPFCLVQLLSPVFFELFCGTISQNPSGRDIEKRMWLLESKAICIENPCIAQTRSFLTRKRGAVCCDTRMAEFAPGPLEYPAQWIFKICSPLHPSAFSPAFVGSAPWACLSGAPLVPRYTNECLQEAVEVLLSILWLSRIDEQTQKFCDTSKFDARKPHFLPGFRPNRLALRLTGKVVFVGDPAGGTVCQKGLQYRISQKVCLEPKWLRLNLQGSSINLNRF